MDGRGEMAVVKKICQLGLSIQCSRLGVEWSWWLGFLDRDEVIRVSYLGFRVLEVFRI